MGDLLMYPNYTFAERIADGFVHVIGISIGLIGFILLLVYAIPSLPVSSTTALVIYGVSMIAMFGFSAAYHLIPLPDWKGMLRRFDQAAIFVKIAATYTPFAFIKMGGFSGYGLLIIVWAIALFGAIAKLYIRERWDKYSIYLYLGLGWVGLLFFYPMFSSIPFASVILLLAGGAFYSIGVVFHLWTSLLYQNAVWHAFVVAGTSCHYAAIVKAVF